MSDHSLSTVRKARMMREAGWSYRQIGEALGVANSTACLWCRPDLWEKQRDRQRARRIRVAEERPKLLATELWEEGLPLKSIVFILDRYHGVEVTPDVLKKNWLPENRTRRPRGKPFGEKAA
jgi:hypothetical protein